MSDMENRAIFSANLKRYMEQTGKTRADICNALGFKYSTFTDWVNGNKYPRIDKIEMLANYFGIEKSDLIERKVPPSEKTEDDDLAEYLEELRRRPEAKILLESSRGMTIEQVKSIVAMIENFRNNS